MIKDWVNLANTMLVRKTFGECPQEKVLQTGLLMFAPESPKRVTRARKKLIQNTACEPPATKITHFETLHQLSLS
jgi:hypothetical protein